MTRFSGRARSTGERHQFWLEFASKGMPAPDRLDLTRIDPRYFVTAAAAAIDGGARGSNVFGSRNELSRLPPEPPPNHESVATESPAAGPAARRDGSHGSFGAWLLGLACLLVGIVGLLAGLKLFFADRTPDLTPEALQAAMEQWQAREPASYDLEVEIGGARPGVARVEVRDGAVTLATRDGRPLDEWNQGEWTIPSQFEMLQREFDFQEDPQNEMGAPRGAQVWLRCEFDPELGYPRRFHRHATGGAPEAFWRNSLQPKK